MDKEELQERLNRAWKYDDYMREQYDSFGEYYNRIFAEANHRDALEEYRDVNDNLMMLVYELNNKIEAN